MRLQVHVVPAHAIPTAPALCTFLEVASPTLSLEDLTISISNRYTRLYPHKLPLKIDKLQDSNGNDLDLCYTVADVFSDKANDNLNSIVRVIQASMLRESSLPPESGLRPQVFAKGVRRKRSTLDDLREESCESDVLPMPVPGQVKSTLFGGGRAKRPRMDDFMVMDSMDEREEELVGRTNVGRWDERDEVVQLDSAGEEEEEQKGGDDHSLKDAVMDNVPLHPEGRISPSLGHHTPEAELTLPTPSLIQRSPSVHVTKVSVVSSRNNGFDEIKEEVPASSPFLEMAQLAQKASSPKVNGRPQTSPFAAPRALQQGQGVNSSSRRHESPRQPRSQSTPRATNGSGASGQSVYSVPVSSEDDNVAKRNKHNSPQKRRSKSRSSIISETASSEADDESSQAQAAHKRQKELEEQEREELVREAEKQKQAEKETREAEAQASESETQAKREQQEAKEREEREARERESREVCERAAKAAERRDRIERERLEEEKLEQERLEQEEIAREKLASKEVEREKTAQEKAARDKLAFEEADRKKATQEKADQKKARAALLKAEKEAKAKEAREVEREKLAVKKVELGEATQEKQALEEAGKVARKEDEQKGVAQEKLLLEGDEKATQEAPQNKQVDQKKPHPKRTMAELKAEREAKAKGAKEAKEKKELERKEKQERQKAEREEKRRVLQEEKERKARERKEAQEKAKKDREQEKVSLKTSERQKKESQEKESQGKEQQNSSNESDSLLALALNSALKHNSVKTSTAKKPTRVSFADENSTTSAALTSSPTPMAPRPVKQTPILPPGFVLKPTASQSLSSSSAPDWVNIPAKSKMLPSTRVMNGVSAVNKEERAKVAGGSGSHGAGIEVSQKGKKSSLKSVPVKKRTDQMLVSGGTVPAKKPEPKKPTKSISESESGSESGSESSSEPGSGLGSEGGFESESESESDDSARKAIPNPSDKAVKTPHSKQSEDMEMADAPSTQTSKKKPLIPSSSAVAAKPSPISKVKAKTAVTRYEESEGGSSPEEEVPSSSLPTSAQKPLNANSQSESGSSTDTDTDTDTETESEFESGSESGNEKPASSATKVPLQTNNHLPTASSQPLPQPGSASGSQRYKSLIDMEMDPIPDVRDIHQAARAAAAGKKSSNGFNSNQAQKQVVHGEEASDASDDEEGSSDDSSDDSEEEGSKLKSKKDALAGRRASAPKKSKGFGFRDLIV